MFTENNPKYKIVEDSIYLIIRDDSVTSGLEDVGVGETVPSPKKTVTSVLYASVEYIYNLSHYKLLVPIVDDLLVVTYEDGKVSSFTSNDDVPTKDEIDSLIEDAVEAEVETKMKERQVMLTREKMKSIAYPYKLDI